MKILDIDWNKLIPVFPTFLVVDQRKAWEKKMLNSYGEWGRELVMNPRQPRH